MCLDRQRFLQLCSLYPYSKRLLKQKAYIRRQYWHELKRRKELLREQQRHMFLQKVVGGSEDVAAKWRHPESEQALRNLLCDSANSMDVAEENVRLLQFAKQVSVRRTSLATCFRSTSTKSR